MSGTVTIGLDVGGTKVAGALLTPSNELLESTRRPTLVDGRRDPGLLVTRGVAEELVQAADRAGLVVDGIGAGFPEYVDRSGRLRSHEVLAWAAQPLALLADLAPVTVEADVRCAALGEGALGVAQGLASYAFIIVGTGLSYALVEDGQARPGARGEAIALGELEVSRSVDTATTRSLERYVSGEGIRERFCATGTPVRDAAEVFALAADGQAQARVVVESAARALGVGLATLVSIIDPAALVLGGGVSAASDGWRALVESAYLERACRRPSPPPLRWATLGSDAGVIGAAVAHRNRMAAAGG